MGIKVNRAKFWELYHKGFDPYGPVGQPTVDNLNAILDKFETEDRLKFIPEYSYALATWFHETGINGNHFVPIREGRERSTSPRRANQDKYWKTGFYGRGLDQTTWEDNYRKSGHDLGLGDLFVQQPDLLLQINYAYEVSISGMATGRYRHHKLSDYFKDDDATLQQYVDARDIINGDKKKNGLLIAGYAEKFEHILTTSQIIQTAGSPPPPTPISPQDTIAVPPIAPAPTESPASAAAATEPESELTKIGNKANAIYTSFGTVIAGVIAWFGSSNGTIVLGVMGCIALLGIAYIIVQTIRAMSKDKADRQERKEAADRELQLKIVRESHAQEAQMFSMKTASDPTIPTVTIGQPPPDTQLPGSGE